jgi:hypothetical protein
VFCPNPREKAENSTPLFFFHPIKPKKDSKAQREKKGIAKP